VPAAAALIVKRSCGDHAVTAAVVGDESPWAERTRQNSGLPSRKHRAVGLLSCGESSSICWKLESLAICNSYPLGCGIGYVCPRQLYGQRQRRPFAARRRRRRSNGIVVEDRVVDDVRGHTGHTICVTA